jgi:hypothetical protein
MPMLNEATTIMTAKMSSANIAASVASAPKFQALPLPADFVYPNDAPRRKLLQNYLNGLPIGMQETIRAAIFHSLTSVPPRPMQFSWSGAYDYKLEINETYDTYYSPRTPGVMGIILNGRYLDDPHPLADHLSQSRRAGASSKRAAKDSPRPAKRRPSKKS